MLDLSPAVNCIGLQNNVNKSRSIIGKTSINNTKNKLYTDMAFLPTVPIGK